MARNEAWVSVGRDHDTSAFAVAAIRQLWGMMGRAAYPAATQLLITADAVGSNGYRTRAWKTKLRRSLVKAFDDDSPDIVAAVQDFGPPSLLCLHPACARNAW